MMTIDRDLLVTATGGTILSPGGGGSTGPTFPRPFPGPDFPGPSWPRPSPSPLPLPWPRPDPLGPLGPISAK